MPPPPRIFPFAECLTIIEALPPQDVIAAMADGFIAFSNGQVSVAPIATLGQPPLANFVGHPDAQACIKSAYVNGGTCFVTKVASGGGGSNSGLVLVFSQLTFAPEAIFLDGGYLTELRTAAAGALAAMHFAPSPLHVIAVIGAGVQARWQLKLLASTVSCRRVRLWSRRSAQAAALIDELRREGWDASAVASIEDAVEGAGLIITVTCAREPLLDAAMLSSCLKSTAAENVLINAIGADSPGKQELSPSLVAGASLALADSRAQCIERGELQHAVGSGLLAPASVVELGEYLSAASTSNPQARRARPSGLVIFDSTGVAVQDVKIAELALQAAPPQRSML